MRTYHILAYCDGMFVYGPFLCVQMVDEQGRKCALNRSGGWILWPNHVVEDTTFEASGWEDAEVHFYKTHFTYPKKVHNSAGWISPEGDFYGCDDYGHNALAQALSAQRYNTTQGSVFLERVGWLRVTNGFVFHNERVPLTQPQIDVLGEFLRLDDSSDFLKDSIRQLITSSV